MPTTNITSKHKLVGNGFSSRATNKLQIGGAGADQANGSSEDASVCLHPVKRAKARAVQAQLPTSIGESSTLFSQLRTNESGRKMRIMSRGTTGSGPWSQSIVDVGPTGLTLPEMMLPSDVLQLASNLGADVGETRLVIPDNVTTMEVKYGDDVVKSDPDVGLGVQLKMMASQITPWYWEVETLTEAAFFTQVHTMTLPETYLKLYSSTNPGNYTDPASPTTTGGYKYDSIPADYSVYAANERYYIHHNNGFPAFLSTQHLPMPGHAYDPYTGAMVGQPDITRNVTVTSTGAGTLLFGEDAAMQAKLAGSLYFARSDYFNPDYPAAASPTTSVTGTISVNDIYTVDPFFQTMFSTTFFLPSGYGPSVSESFSYDLPSLQFPTNLRAQAEQQALALTPGAVVDFENELANGDVPIWAPTDITEQDVLASGVSPSASIDLRALEVVDFAVTQVAEGADPGLALDFTDTPVGGTYLDSPNYQTLVSSTPTSTSEYPINTVFGAPLVSFANGGVSPYRLLLSRTESHEVTFGNNLFSIADVLDNDTLSRDNNVYDLPFLYNNSGDPYLTPYLGASYPSVEVSTIDPSTAVTPPNYYNPQSYLSDSVTLPNGGVYSFSGSSLLLLPVESSSRYTLEFDGTSDISVIESSHRSNAVVPVPGTAVGELSVSNYPFTFFSSYHSLHSYDLNTWGIIGANVSQGEYGGDVNFDIITDTTIEGIPVHRTLATGYNAFDRAIYSYTDYGQPTIQPGHLLTNFWRSRAAFMAGFAPYVDPTTASTSVSQNPNGGTYYTDPLDGAKQVLHPTAVIGYSEGWFLTPANPGQAAAANNQWFDAHKLASDLLQPNQVINMDARLDEEVFSGILTHKYSPAAVYEAIIHAIALDVINEDNGWDTSLDPLKDETSADKFFSQEARLGAIKAALPVVTSMDPSTYDENMFNTGGYTGLVFGIYKASDTYHGDLTPSIFDLPGELNSLVLADPTTIATNALNICSTDGEQELGMMGSILELLLNSTQNAAANATFVNLWWTKVQTFMGSSVMETIDQCSIQYHNESSGHLAPAMYYANTSDVPRLIFCGRPYSHAFTTGGNNASGDGKTAFRLDPDVLRDPGPALIGDVADICIGISYEVADLPTHLDDYVEPMTFTDRLDLTSGTYTKLDGTVGTAQDVLDDGPNGFVTDNLSVLLEKNTTVQTPLYFQGLYGVDPLTWEPATGRDTVLDNLPSTRAWYYTFSDVHTDSYQYKFISAEVGSMSTLDDLVLEQENPRTGVPSSLTMVPANMANLALGQVDLPAYYTTSADQYWNSQLPLVSELDVSSTLVNSRGDLAVSYRLLQSGQVIRPGVAYELPNVTSHPTVTGSVGSAAWRTFTWDDTIGVSQELTENRELTLIDTSLTPFTMNLVTDVTDGEIRKTWDDESHLVFDGATGLFLYDTGEVTGVHSGEFDPQGGNAPSQEESSVLTELISRQAEFNTAMDTTVDGRLLNFDEQLLLSTAGISNGPITAHPSLSARSTAIILPDGDEHESDFRVQPSGGTNSTSTVYYQYTTGGDTRYMYPVFTQLGLAAAADVSYGGSGAAGAYVVTATGDTPVFAADPNAVTLNAGESLVYLPATGASDMRDALSREFILYDLALQGGIVQSRTFDAAAVEVSSGQPVVGGSTTFELGYSDTVDMFFAGADVVLSGKDAYPLRGVSFLYKEETTALIDGTHTVPDLTGMGRVTPGSGGSLEITVSGGEVTGIAITDPGSEFTLGSNIYIDKLSDLGLAVNNTMWILLKVDCVDLESGSPIDPLSAVNPNAGGAQTALLTWDALATAATRPESGGLTSDPDPGRAILYEMYNLAIQTDNDPGEPWLAPSPCILSDRQQEAVKAGLTLKGSRLASRFLPGSTGTEIQSTDLRRSYKMGLDRIAAGNPQHAMASPSDDPFTIDSLYLNDFLPMRYVDKAKRL